MDNSAIPTAATGAVYKGLAVATLNGHQFLYATNFRSGNVDVFDAAYNPVTNLTGTFTDPHPLAGYAPFGITLFGTSNLWVSYALQDGPKHDPVHMAGAGYIDIFTTDGVFVERFATGGNLNAPWGMVLTPPSFGPMGGNYWIGNFGDGNINAFNSMATDVGQPKDKNGKPLHVDGLWALVFGTAPTKRLRPRCISPRARTWKARESSASSTSRPKNLRVMAAAGASEADLTAQCPE